MANKYQNETPERNEEMVMPESASEVRHSHLGAILGVLVVVLVLILGGLYLWGSTLSEEQDQTVPREIENNEPETPRSEANDQIMQTVSSSDELDAIEADLESTNLDDLTTDLDTIDRELEAAYSSQ